MKMQQDQIQAAFAAKATKSPQPLSALRRVCSFFCSELKENKTREHKNEHRRSNTTTPIFCSETFKHNNFTNQTALDGKAFSAELSGPFL